MANSVAHFFREYVLKNLPFKLVSLAIAILLWWSVGRDQLIEMPHDGAAGVSSLARQSGYQLELSIPGADNAAWS